MIARTSNKAARIGVPALILVLALTGLGGSSLLWADTGATAAGGVQALESIQSAYRSVAQTVIPTVVEIDVVDVVKQPANVNPFQFFFGPQGPRGQNQAPQEREFRQQGLGSGVVVRRDGNKVYVLTNNHVVGEADEISVKMADGREFKGALVGTDERKDLALVAFETRETVPVARLGDSDSVQVGDLVLAVGSPLGFASSITSGIISAVGRNSMPGSDLASFTDYIQTDAAINQGNSGGALVNIRGEVVGINTWIASPSGGNVGLGFAIPINNAGKIVDQLISKGKVEYGWLGVFIGNLSQEAATDLGLVGVKGAFVSNIFRGSPADKAGIQPGDFVTSLNGTPVQDSNQLMRMVGTLAPGDTARFDLLRQGNRLTLTAKITAREQEKDIASQANRVWPGLYVANLNSDVRKGLNLAGSVSGVVVANVDQGSAAQVAGVQQGDVIQQINGKALKNVQDFYAQLDTKKGKELNFRILRQGVELSIGLVA
jgi:Do/DeqQ family serine protease